MSYREFPEPVVRAAIFDALKADDHPAVQGLLRVYAAWYPEDCETLMAAVDFAAKVSIASDRG
jgi:hypothetical protein